MSVDTISSEDPGAGLGGAAGDRPMRSGGRATALTTAISLVLTAGVVTAAVRSAGHGTAPDTLVPATAFGYAQADLDLPGGQSGALSSLLAHFPDSPTNHGHGSLRDRILAAMFRDSSDPHVDYTKDVEPWLGDHAAVAGWLDSDGNPQVELLLQSTDDAAARAALHRLAPDMGVTFSDGYAVLAPAQRIAEEAVDTAKRSSLAAAGRYRDDVARLGGGAQVLTGWVDAAGAAKAIGKGTSVMNPLAMMPGGLLATPQSLGRIKGRVVVGVHATDRYAEVVSRTIGAAPSQTGLAPASMLTRLPDRTIGAVEMASPGKVVTAAWGLLGMFFGGASESAVAIPAVTPAVTPPATPPATPVPPGAYGSSVQICVQGRPCVSRMSPQWQPYQPGVHVAPPRNYEMRSDPAHEIAKVTGLTVPADLVTLLGSAAVVSYGGLSGSVGLPNLAVVSHPADVSGARTLAEHARDVLATETGVHVTVGATGSDLVVASNGDYAALVTTGGHLGAQSRFAAAMGSLPDQVGFAAYVDLADVLPLLSHGQRDLDHLDALGIWTGQVGSDELMQVRLVVK